MNFLITALGSYGDVLPMVGLAQALTGRGHAATVVTNPYFGQIVEDAGVGFEPLGTAEEYRELSRHPDLWNPVRGPMLVMKNARHYLRELYELIDERCQSKQTVLVAHCLDFASRVHQDKHGTAVASVQFAPICLRSVHQAPQMFNMLLQDWWPRWFKRLQFWLADKVADRMVTPSLNELRSDLGLPPARGIFAAWMFSPESVLCMFPDWFAPPQPDWPSNVATTGFPLWDPVESMPLSAEVEQFLQTGEPPLVFAPGSAMTEGHEFFAEAIDACQRLGRRGILCTKYREQLPDHLPEGIGCFGFVPFSQLLPRAAALVHHGGIGTCAQGLAAGLPQVVMPMAYDQLDNATRLKRLGVAKIIRRKRFRAPKVAAYLQELLDSEEVGSKAKEYAQRMDGKQSLEAACEALERLGAKNSRLAKDKRGEDHD